MSKADPASTDRAREQKAFGKLLERAARSQDLSNAEISRLTGVSTSAITRVFQGGAGPSGSASVDMVIRIRDLLVSRGAVLPPVFGSAARGDPTDDLSEWARLGSDLRAVSKPQFDKALAAVRELVRAHRLVSSGISLIAEPLPATPDADDK